MDEQLPNTLRGSRSDEASASYYRSKPIGGSSVHKGHLLPLYEPDGESLPMIYVQTLAH